MSGVVHGGVTEAELALAAAEGRTLVDLSASLNPYGPHEAVVHAARNAPFARYPEADAATLRAACARRYALPPAQVLAGNGSTELLYLVARCFPGAALVAGPTFGEYRAACSAAGLDVVEVLPASGVAHTPERLLFAVAARRPSLVFLCNPNNPTGQLWRRDEVMEAAAAVREVGGHLLVDEAYMDFAVPDGERLAVAPGLLLLRSLTKVHAIPGLRLGFLMAEEDVIAKVEAQQPSWPVSAPAIAAGLEALRHEAWERECCRAIAGARETLRAALCGAGLAVAPSRANFLLVEVGGAPAFRARMLRRGWVVRDCTSFGLPRHVRVAIPARDLAGRLARDIVECVE